MNAVGQQKVVRVLREVVHLSEHGERQFARGESAGGGGEDVHGIAVVAAHQVVQTAFHKGFQFLKNFQRFLGALFGVGGNDLLEIIRREGIY